jgi:hypothetical protein
MAEKDKNKQQGGINGNENINDINAARPGA